jgi:hypothetical protein
MGHNYVSSDINSNAQEAITAYLESLKAHGDPIPAEDLLIRPVEVGLCSSHGESPSRDSSSLRSSE